MNCLWVFHAKRSLLLSTVTTIDTTRRFRRLQNAISVTPVILQVLLQSRAACKANSWRAENDLPKTKILATWPSHGNFSAFDIFVFVCATRKVGYFSCSCGSRKRKVFVLHGNFSAFDIFVLLTNCRFRVARATRVVGKSLPKTKRFSFSGGVFGTSRVGLRSEYTKSLDKSPAKQIQIEPLNWNVGPLNWKCDPKSEMHVVRGP